MNLFKKIFYKAYRALAFSNLQIKGFMARNFIHRKHNSRLTVIFFAHIPKTGGNAIAQYFKNSLLKYGARQIDYFLSKAARLPRNNPSYRIKLIRKKIDQIGTSIKKGIIYIHWHHGAHGLLGEYEYLIKLKSRVLKNEGKIVFCTVLREPYARTISALNYNNTPIDRIDSFIKTRYNLQIRYLLHNHPRYWSKNIKEFSEFELNKVLSLFDSIGTQSNLNDFIAQVKNKIDILFQALNVSLNNVTEFIDPKKESLVDKALFTKLNKREIQLYKTICE